MAADVRIGGPGRRWRARAWHRGESFEEEAFAAALAESLARMLSAASQLPAVTPTETDLPDRPSTSQWSERFAAVQRVLGDWDAYWTRLAPHGDGAEEAVTLPLGDDLADNWHDLKQGLLALEEGAQPNDVIWEVALRLLHPLGPSRDRRAAGASCSRCQQRRSDGRGRRTLGGAAALPAGFGTPSLRNPRARPAGARAAGCRQTCGPRSDLVCADAAHSR